MSKSADKCKYLINHTTRTVHSTKSRKQVCQPLKSDTIGYSDMEKNLKAFIFCECTK